MDRDLDRHSGPVFGWNMNPSPFAAIQVFSSAGSCPVHVLDPTRVHGQSSQPIEIVMLPAMPSNSSALKDAP